MTLSYFDIWEWIRMLIDFRTFWECLEPYKLVIGQILLLLPNVKTVVNKINSIDNTYRNFAMETLAGML